MIQGLVGLSRGFEGAVPCQRRVEISEPFAVGKRFIAAKEILPED